MIQLNLNGLWLVDTTSHTPDLAERLTAYTTDYSTTTSSAHAGNVLNHCSGSTLWYDTVYGTLLRVCMHTHAHTHTRTHAHTHAHTHSCGRVHVCCASTGCASAYGMHASFCAGRMCSGEQVPSYRTSSLMLSKRCC